MVTRCRQGRGGGVTGEANEDLQVRAQLAGTVVGLCTVHSHARFLFLLPCEGSVMLVSPSISNICTSPANTHHQYVEASWPVSGVRSWTSTSCLPKGLSPRAVTTGVDYQRCTGCFSCKPLLSYTHTPIVTTTFKSNFVSFYYECNTC